MPPKTPSGSSRKIHTYFETHATSSWPYTSQPKPFEKGIKAYYKEQHNVRCWYKK
jgi:hypothetical protein